MVSRGKMFPNLCALLSLQKQNCVCAQVNMNSLNMVDVCIRIHILTFENNTNFETPQDISPLSNERATFL
jgi:hypothetical protein